MMETTSLRTILGGTALLPFVMAAMAHAQGGGWEITPRVSLGQIYTDNVDLSPRRSEEPGVVVRPDDEGSTGDFDEAGDENAVEERDRGGEESITELDLGVTMRRESQSLSARVFYNLQALGYWRDSDRNDVFHQFAGDGRAGLVPDRLFLDAAASYRQRLVSREGSIGDNVNTTGNRTDVATFRVSPFVVQRWGDEASGELRFAYDRVAYKDDGEIEASDDSSESNQWIARVDSGPAFSQVGWGLTFDRTETDFDDGSSVTFQQAEALGRWNATPRFSVFGAVGDERNDFEQDPSRAQPDDTFWRAGATYRPQSGTVIEGFFGERFFGRTYGGSVEHRLRTGRLFANYEESLATSDRFDLVTVTVFDVDEFGLPVELELEVPDLRSGVFLSKRFVAGFSGERGRLAWGLRVLDERKEYELDDTRERTQSIGANGSWSVQPRTRVFASGRVEETTFARQEGREDQLLSAQLGVSRDLGPRTVARFFYSYRERDSNLSDDNDYRENRLTATVTRTF